MGGGAAILFAACVVLAACHDGVQLLQTHLNLSLQPGLKEKLPALMPLARSLNSEDPEAAAQFFIRYFGARKVATNLTKIMQTPCLEAVSVELSRQDGILKSPMDKYTITFIKDDLKWAGDLPRNTFETLSDMAYREMVTSGKLKDHRPWMDFHDGLMPTFWWRSDADQSIYSDGTLNYLGKGTHNVSGGWCCRRNITAIVEDNMPIQRFGSDPWPTSLRPKIHNSSWTIEMDGLYWAAGMLHAPDFTSEEFMWALSQQKSDGGCRIIEPEPTTNDPLAMVWKRSSLWYKATYAVDEASLKVVTEFANDALGFPTVESPFPEPNEDCISATWNEYNESYNFRLHFVSASPPFPNSGTDTYHKYQASIRNLESGCFDHYLYNSLILWSESLDPFVRRLQQLGTPFLALRLQDQLFSLVFSFPAAAAIVVDIRSSILSEVEPTDFDPCSHTQCSGSRDQRNA